MLRLNADFPPLSPGFTAKQLMKDPNKRAQVTRLLQHADLGILSAKASEHQFKEGDLPSDMPDEFVKQLIDKKHIKISLGHRGVEGREYALEWEDESSGTAHCQQTQLSSTILWALPCDRRPGWR